MNSSSLSWICRTRSATKIHKCMYYSYPEKTNFSRTRVPTYYLQNVCPFSVNLRPQRSFMSRFIIIRGLPYMTSAVGGGRGVPKKQKKGTKSADLWQWSPSQKIRKFCGRLIWKPLNVSILPIVGTENGDVWTEKKLNCFVRHRSPNCTPQPQQYQRKSPRPLCLRSV